MVRAVFTPEAELTLFLRMRTKEIAKTLLLIMLRWLYIQSTCRQPHMCGLVCRLRAISRGYQQHSRGWFFWSTSWTMPWRLILTRWTKVSVNRLLGWSRCAAPGQIWSSVIRSNERPNRLYTHKVYAVPDIQGTKNNTHYCRKCRLFTFSVVRV